MKKLGASLLALAGVVALGWGFPDGSTKARGPWQAFDEAWFRDHQSSLVSLLNESSVARSALCVDLPMATKVAAIGPNRIVYGVRRLEDGRVEATMDVRTHAKWSKRVYRLGKGFWWAAHAADLVLDAHAPSLSFGLATLTAFPNAASGATTFDDFAGASSNASPTWSQITGAAGNSHDDTNGVLVVQYDASHDFATAELYRSTFTFDASALGASASISAVVLSIYGTDHANDMGGSPDSDIYNASPASNNAGANSDYQNCGSTSQTGSPISYAAFSVSGYNAFTFSATGRASVSKTGISKFCWRNASYDVSNTAPPNPASLKADYLVASSADAAGTSQDPKLVVTFTTATFNALNVSGD